MHPKGMPKDIISKLNATRRGGTVRSRLADLGIKVFPREQQAPKALGALR
jgi:hypothetical protein